MENMKKWKAPVMTVIRFDASDVIATSSGNLFGSAVKQQKAMSIDSLRVTAPQNVNDLFDHTT